MFRAGQHWQLPSLLDVIGCLRMAGEEPGGRHFELLSGTNSASSVTLYPVIPTFCHQISIASIQ